MARIRVGVVGVGHLGRIHARLLPTHQAAEFVAVADVSEKNRDAAASKHGVAAFADYRDLIGKVDAVCLAVPTVLHCEVASFFLARGVDVLVEKPIAVTVAEGETMVALAAQHGRILQVGHVERFNPALRAMTELGIEPRYIESQRLAPFSFRSVDVGVVLDLMIHDLDLVLALMRTPVTRVQAFGGAVFTANEDMASAILHFEGGGIAHLTASRVALKPSRRMRVFSRDGYVGMDLTAAKATLIKKNPGWEIGELDISKYGDSRPEDLWRLVFDGLLTVQELKLDDRNALQDEQSDFLRACADRSRPVVSGEDGCKALAVAQRVVDEIRSIRW